MSAKSDAGSAEPGIGDLHDEIERLADLGDWSVPRRGGFWFDRCSRARGEKAKAIRDMVPQDSRPPLDTSQRRDTGCGCLGPGSHGWRVLEDSSLSGRIFFSFPARDLARIRSNKNGPSRTLQAGIPALVLRGQNSIFVWPSCCSGVVAPGAPVLLLFGCGCCPANLICFNPM